MGKKNKDQDPAASLNSVANRDIVQRINFLYQASTYLSTISQSLPPSAEDTAKTGREKAKSGKKQKRRPNLRHPRNVAELSRNYVGTMRIVGQKTMVRMDPCVKRTLCKGCDAILMPGATATVRIHPLPSHGEAVVYTCTNCQTIRRIPAAPVLDPDASPLDVAEASTDLVPNSASISSGLDVESTDNVDPPRAQGAPVSARQRRGKHPNRNTIPRLPPLFERKGHVVFRGNERLPAED
ncbi:Rpr2-domain-containing protein [Cubamyces sp. BRFM 1775]|nr:Rpr2-domain-containing protein [Cubamyces sp. BRFM 1775]